LIDVLKTAAAGTREALAWAQAELTGGAHTLRYVALVPAFLIACFTYLHFRKAAS
jgi:hypothetical protein